ncbi:hypothetical protein [Erythrobacter sp. QSSC1-22B]|uniref:hypothetical protein n=1 Tax=Erythrobacter sp. QSSC1-22B TaxID=1860125 RepID=UPI00143AEE15|nr:hypothetical protein [Erythrobacter sp. QSSC1-22B]
MSLSLYEKVWFIAGISFVAYPIGDILGYWDIKAPVVLLWSGLLLLTGWKVGKRI